MDEVESQDCWNWRSDSWCCTLAQGLEQTHQKGPGWSPWFTIQDSACQVESGSRHNSDWVVSHQIRHTPLGRDRASGADREAHWRTDVKTGCPQAEGDGGREARKREGKGTRTLSRRWRREATMSFLLFWWRLQKGEAMWFFSWRSRWQEEVLGLWVSRPFCPCMHASKGLFWEQPTKGQSLEVWGWTRRKSEGVRCSYSAELWIGDQRSDGGGEQDAEEFDSFEQLSGNNSVFFSIQRWRKQAGDDGSAAEAAERSEDEGAEDSEDLIRSLSRPDRQRCDTCTAPQEAGRRHLPVQEGWSFTSRRPDCPLGHQCWRNDGQWGGGHRANCPYECADERSWMWSSLESRWTVDHPSRSWQSSSSTSWRLSSDFQTTCAATDWGDWKKEVEDRWEGWRFFTRSRVDEKAGGWTPAAEVSSRLDQGGIALWGWRMESASCEQKSEEEDAERWIHPSPVCRPKWRMHTTTSMAASWRSRLAAVGDGCGQRRRSRSSEAKGLWRTDASGFGRENQGGSGRSKLQDEERLAPLSHWRESTSSQASEELGRRRVWVQALDPSRAPTGHRGWLAAVANDLHLHGSHICCQGKRRTSRPAVQSGTAGIPQAIYARSGELLGHWRMEEAERRVFLHWGDVWTRQVGWEVCKANHIWGSLQLNVEDYKITSKRHPSRVNSSKELARWPPMLMMMLADELIKQVYQVTPKLKPMSWQEHLAFGHIPYRRDCKICQETLQQCAPHRKSKHVIGGVLSLDTAGPLIGAYDQGGGMARYFLAGALTWRVPKGTNRLQQPPTQSLEGDEPWIEDREEGEVEDGEDQLGILPPMPPVELGSDHDDLVRLPARQGGEPDQGPPGGAPGEMGSDGGDRVPAGEMGSDGGDLVRLPAGQGGEAPQAPPGGEPGEQGSDEGCLVRLPGPPKEESLEETTELRVFRMALPMVTKTSREVSATAMEFILRLRADGYHVGRIHCDRGHEFDGAFRKWARSRGIYITKTAGDDPQGNGRAEVTVKALKTQVRRALRQANLDSSYWPWALRHVDEINRCIRKDITPN